MSAAPFPTPSLDARCTDVDPATRRVLIVSPHFPPVNAPDHQRVRTALPYLQAGGWTPHILTVQHQAANHGCDRTLAEQLPRALDCTTTPALPYRLTRLVGLGHLGWRSLPYLRQAGNRLLASGAFDLVFFSTTIFPVMILGPYWQQRFGVPYVIDLQDPWRVDRVPAGHHRPGGRLKYALDKTLARILEPAVMQQAKHIVTVSPAYPPMLRQRYPNLQPEQFTVLPFGAPEADFEHLTQRRIQPTYVQPQDGRRHWVYVGRGGPDMAPALRILFSALRQMCDRTPNLASLLHLHFIGTSYAPPHLARKTIEPIAAQFGVANLVTEHCQRVPYFEAQQLLVNSDAILLLGSADASYTASKLYPAILARRPILAIFHEHSSVVSILQQVQAGAVVPFSDPTADERVNQSLSHAVLAHMERLLAQPRETEPATDWHAFEPYTARAMTQTLCTLFDRCAASVSAPALP